MTREIKFRAWINKTKTMTPPVTIQELFVNNKEFISSDENKRKWVAEQIVFMQYTGLKDRNGKEIYEGDITRENGYNYDPDKVIVWEKGGFNICGGSKCEVIGNIYEHSELLNEKPTPKKNP